MDILDDLPLLKLFGKIFKPKSRRMVKILLGVAVLAFPSSFGAWMVHHALVRREVLANAAGTYLTSGLVRSMGTLKITAPPALRAPALPAPAMDDPSKPLILTVPSNAHGGH